MESAQNPWLVFLLDQLENQVKLLRLQTLQAPVDVKKIQAEHWQIVDAIARQDTVAASEHIQQHLRISQSRIVQIFESQPQLVQPPQPQSCPRCKSNQLKKNGRRQDRQNYLCKQCGRQFLETTVSCK